MDKSSSTVWSSIKAARYSSEGEADRRLRELVKREKEREAKEIRLLELSLEFLGRQSRYMNERREFNGKVVVVRKASDRKALSGYRMDRLGI